MESLDVCTIITGVYFTLCLPPVNAWWKNEENPLSFVISPNFSILNKIILLIINSYSLPKPANELYIFEPVQCSSNRRQVLKEGRKEPFRLAMSFLDKNTNEYQWFIPVNNWNRQTMNFCITKTPYKYWFSHLMAQNSTE